MRCCASPNCSEERHHARIVSTPVRRRDCIAASQNRSPSLTTPHLNQQECAARSSWPFPVQTKLRRLEGTPDDEICSAESLLANSHCHLALWHRRRTALCFGL